MTDRPIDLWEAAFSWGRGMKPYRGTVFCGAPTKLIGRRLFCRACGYFESCCDGGKESVPGEC